MNTLAHYVGWAVIVTGSLLAAASLVTMVPYMILDFCWRRMRAQKQFIEIGMRYFAEKNKTKAKDREIMGTPE